jgi:hypothetical protein
MAVNARMISPNYTNKATTLVADYLLSKGHLMRLQSTSNDRAWLPWRQQPGWICDPSPLCGCPLCGMRALRRVFRSDGRIFLTPFACFEPKSPDAILAELEIFP